MTACLLVLSIIATATPLWAHCQIPCGIYGDAARFAEMREHVTTIEKSMQEIQQLSSGSTVNWNQLVRWIDNKEHHADELAQIITYYFMTQRVKPVAPTDATVHARYIEHLQLLHGMLVAAMKCKQTTDVAHVEQLRQLIGAFEDAYGER
jgi:nickel superoxide dismutase